MNAHCGQGFSGLRSFGGRAKSSNCRTTFAPWRLAVPTQSEPVSPPPKTTTFLSSALIRVLAGTF